ncbi:MAG: metal-dependent hydrolase [Thermodesulfobacteriaceae bacterium]|nr:metal-dependent hydrolase [Thermodesulfobacteriaceae bacterium]MCX8041172.1 metal-dependent hydrolase [Thermodesulfobacteriaceae bacterium]MDW8135190.1 metal-dependent hydrolase [Thermodesulfobacterium sp.]
MQITYYGHSCFKIVSPKGKKILIDPWVSNPLAPTQVDLGPYDFILITHAHGDHLGEVVKLARTNITEVIAIHEIQQYLLKSGVPKTTGMNIGGSYKVEELTFIMVPAWHSSSLPDGSYGGEACGFVITLENGLTLYHTGDTGLFYDMKLIGELYQPKIVFLPIGSHYVMGPKEAAKACDLIRPEIVIPMHYKTFPLLTGTVEDFKEELSKYSFIPQVLILKPGETFNF